MLKLHGEVGSIVSVNVKKMIKSRLDLQLYEPGDAADDAACDTGNGCSYHVSLRGFRLLDDRNETTDDIENGDDERAKGK